MSVLRAYAGSDATRVPGVVRGGVPSGRHRLVQMSGVWRCHLEWCSSAGCNTRGYGPGSVPRSGRVEGEQGARALAMRNRTSSAARGETDARPSSCLRSTLPLRTVKESCAVVAIRAGSPTHRTPKRRRGPRLKDCGCLHQRLDGETRRSVQRRLDLRACQPHCGLSHMGVLGIRGVVHPHIRRVMHRLLTTGRRKPDSTDSVGQCATPILSP